MKIGLFGSRTTSSQSKARLHVTNINKDAKFYLTSMKNSKNGCFMNLNNFSTELKINSFTAIDN